MDNMGAIETLKRRIKKVTEKMSQLEKHNIYNDDFYRKRNQKTKYAAKRIIDILEQYFEINSAVDVGCGVGTWLSELKKKGARRVLGLDGDYVNRKYLVIDKDEFIPYNLSKSISVDEKFDLASSLEVAEHLPEKRAKGFVSDLCKLSDVVCFSAATKAQGGDGHVNEQRLSYWIRLFDGRGYKPLDIVRPEIWNDKKIPVWYRENIVIFVKNCNVELANTHIFDIVHPDLYEDKIREYEILKNKWYVKVFAKIEKIIVAYIK